MEFLVIVVVWVVLGLLVQVGVGLKVVRLVGELGAKVVVGVVVEMVEGVVGQVVVVEEVVGEIV